MGKVVIFILFLFKLHCKFLKNRNYSVSHNSFLSHCYVLLTTYVHACSHVPQNKNYSNELLVINVKGFLVNLALKFYSFDTLFL